MNAEVVRTQKNSRNECRERQRLGEAREFPVDLMMLAEVDRLRMEISFDLGVASLRHKSWELVALHRNSLGNWEAHGKYHCAPDIVAMLPILDSKLEPRCYAVPREDGEMLYAWFMAFVKVLGPILGQTQYVYKDHEGDGCFFIRGVV